MSTSASASKIPNKKILKKSRKSDLLEDRLLVPVEQDVSLPFDKKIVELTRDLAGMSLEVYEKNKAVSDRDKFIEELKKE